MFAAAPSSPSPRPSPEQLRKAPATFASGKAQSKSLPGGRAPWRGPGTLGSFRGSLHPTFQRSHPACSHATAPCLLPGWGSPGSSSGRRHCPARHWRPASHQDPRAALHVHPAAVPPAPPALEPGLPGLRRAAGHRRRRPPAPPALTPRAHPGTPRLGPPAPLPGHHPLQLQPGTLPAPHQAGPLLGGAVAGAGPGEPLAGARDAGRAGGGPARVADASCQLLTLLAAPPL